VRLAVYVRRLARELRGADVVHVMANSGWSWHLFAMPAIQMAHRLGVPVVVNYRGGEAPEFFARSWKWVRRSISKAAAIVVPSTFLREVFAQYGVEAQVVPNVVDLSRFSPREQTDGGAPSQAPILLVARNLETIYDIGTAIRAFHQVRASHPGATLIVAGSGPEAANLQAEAAALSLGSSVRFVGRVDNADMPALYRSADFMVNTSLVDNTPNAILEAWASGVTVVSRDVGGIPHLVEDGVTGCLVPARAPQAVAATIEALIADPARYGRLRSAGLAKAAEFAWENVRGKWYGVYDVACGSNRTAGRIPRVDAKVLE
jgi:glycosyltransferase involved in cell wall biosynthesis